MLGYPSIVQYNCTSISVVAVAISQVQDYLCENIELVLM